jgi:hypothetical protein
VKRADPDRVHPAPVRPAHPGQQDRRPDLDGRLSSLGLKVAEATSSNPATTPGRDGKRAADNVIAARRNDGANRAGNYADTTGYTPVNSPDVLVDPWRWQPVRVPLGDPYGTPQTPLTPQWGKVRPFDPKLLEQSAQAPNPFNLSAQERSAMIDELVRLSAELDASVSAWSIKYRYDLGRPVSVIPALRGGHGPRRRCPRRDRDHQGR